jgi:RHS repeat-associated protein
LTGVRLPVGVPNTFTYNADDERVQRQDSNGTLNEIWDQQNVLLETDQNGVTQAIYTLTPASYGNLISQFRNAATNFYHFDGLGSTDRLTDVNQTVTDNYLYIAFGTIRTSTGSTANAYRYQGRIGYYYDPDVVQMYVRARHYIPAIGRFASRDAAGIQLPDREQLYVYATNNPLVYGDPSGLKKCYVGEETGWALACDVDSGSNGNGDGCRGSGGTYSRASISAHLLPENLLWPFVQPIAHVGTSIGIRAQARTGWEHGIRSGPTKLDDGIFGYELTIRVYPPSSPPRPADAEQIWQVNYNFGWIIDAITVSVRSRDVSPFQL